MDKYIRRHIIIEYWFILVFTILSILGSIAYMFIDELLLVYNPFLYHANTLIMILLFLWIKFLKNKIRQNG